MDELKKLKQKLKDQTTPKNPTEALLDKLQVKPVSTEVPTKDRFGKLKTLFKK